jgi:hypothetical protein
MVVPENQRHRTVAFIVIMVGSVGQDQRKGDNTAVSLFHPDLGVVPQNRLIADGVSAWGRGEAPGR